MKHLCVICGLFIALLFGSCVRNNSDSSNTLSVSESEHEYKVSAEYPKQNTERLAHYMNEKIGDKNHISFLHAVIDAEMTLDDGTKIYVVNKPGTLKINLNKDQNSRASYEEIKSLGEGLKSFLDAPDQ